MDPEYIFETNWKYSNRHVCQDSCQTPYSEEILSSPPLQPFKVVYDNPTLQDLMREYVPGFKG